MNPGDSRRAPEGTFRVVGYDQYDYTDYVVGDFATPQEAVRVARAKAAVPNGIPTSSQTCPSFTTTEGSVWNK